MIFIWRIVAETLLEIGKLLWKALVQIKDGFVSLCAWNGWVAAGVTMVVLMSLAEIVLPAPFNQQASSLFQNLILGEVFLWLIYKFMNRTPGSHGKHHDHGHESDHH